MPTRGFDFDGADGIRLSGRLELPDGPVRGWALFAHCFTCGKDGLAGVRIARTLAAQGIGVLRFDFAGLGTSSGDFAGTTFASNIGDVVAAAHAMTADGKAPALLIGHSLGGAAVLAAAGGLPEVRAVATIAAPFDVAHVVNQFAPEGLAEIAAKGAAQVVLAGRPFTVGQAFIDDLARHDQAARITALHQPLLIMHAPRDLTVGIDSATRIFGAARHARSFVSLDGADHLLTGRGDAEYAAGVIAAWAVRWLAVPVAEAVREADAVAEETGTGRFQVAIRTGGTTFLADEPADIGGAGSGPTPYDLLCSALAACTTMTLRFYAEGKKWPVERIRTAVDHSKEPGATPADVFDRRIEISGDLDASQRQRLLEIAGRCPVHRTLEAGTRVVTSAANPPAQSASDAGTQG